MKRFKNPWDWEAAVAHLCTVGFILPYLKGKNTKTNTNNSVWWRIEGLSASISGRWSSLEVARSSLRRSGRWSVVEYSRGREKSKLGMENFSGNNVSAHPRGRLWHSPAFRSARYGCQAPSLTVQLSALVPAAGRETLQPLVLGEAGQPAVQDCFCLGTLGLRGIPSKSG